MMKPPDFIKMEKSKLWFFHQTLCRKVQNNTSTTDNLRSINFPKIDDYSIQSNWTTYIICFISIKIYKKERMCRADLHFSKSKNCFAEEPHTEKLKNQWCIIHKHDTFSNDISYISSIQWFINYSYHFMLQTSKSKLGHLKICPQKRVRMSLPYRKCFKFASFYSTPISLNVNFWVKDVPIPPIGSQLSFTVKNVPPFNEIMRWICGALIIGCGSGNWENVGFNWMSI